MTDFTPVDAIERPLAGFVILDLLDDNLGGVTRPYAELGAEVVRIDPRGAFGGAEPRSAAGVRWLAAHFGKRVIAAGSDADRDRADMIVTGITGVPDPARPEAIVMTVSMFGAGSSFEGWQATDPILHALTGELSRSGIDGREPLIPPGELAMQCGMSQAAYVGMAALYAARLTGVGDRLDVSLLDGAVQALDPGFGISGSATLGRPASNLPPGRPVKGFQYPIMPCADGQVRLCVLAVRQWQGLFRWMGEPAAFAGPEFMNVRVRQESTALTAAIGAFVAGQSCAELEREGSARGVPISGVLTIEQCLASPQIDARGAVISAPLPDGSSIRLPAGTISIDGVRMNAPAVPLPAVGSGHRAAIGSGSPARPLAGIKVLDLGVIVVGGEQSRLLADLGADIVKIESSTFPDGTRQSYLPTGLSVSFAAGHRNKRSLGLDLRRPEGKALFLRLAAEADIILSNFKPGTMESLGLDHAAISAINPRIIMAESSAFGATGPWAGRMGYGPLVRAAAGLTAQWRYQDSADSYSDSITIYPDHVSGRLGALAVLSLLIRRLRTGRGGQASLSQMEVMLGHMAGRIAAASIGLDDAGDPPDAPWGVFRAAGEDQWCVITVRNDADWMALARVLGRDDWAGKAYATAELRKGRREEIGQGVVTWLATQDADKAMRLLQSAGVPAAHMLRVGDLPEFDYYKERGFFRIDRHPFMDEPIIAERRHAVSRLLAEPESRPAPLMGEHSAEVVSDWLGLEGAEIETLLRQGVIESVPAEIARMVAAGEGRCPA